MFKTFGAVSGFGLEVERLLEQTSHTNALPNKICAAQCKPWHVVQSILFRNPGFVLRHCPVPSDTRAAGSTGDGVCKEMMADLLLWALDHSPSEHNYIVIISDVQDRIFASVLYQMHLKGYRIFQATPQAAKFGLLHRVIAEWPSSFFTIIPDRLQLPLKVLDQHEQHENQANLENFGTGIGSAPVQPLKRFASDCDLQGQPAGKGYDQAALKNDFKTRFGYELDNKAAGYKSLGMFLDVTMPELQRTRLSSKGANLLFLPAAS
ncbi:unnamed protein product [Sphagnum troendelagicum]|uniref:NYN domain-containing protein n=1 Tax=Sphagnum troendelagicum TaxID=128251 RepID=A0ABP0U6G1_9BRYO